MSYSLKYLQEVQQDIKNAYDWYESRRSGLGDEFVQTIEQLLDRIAKNPFAFPPEEGCHKAVLARFPFNVYFEIQDSEITIIAVFHTAQDPDIWKQR